MKGWYVIGRDGHVADNYVDAWGPFDSEIDAKCYAIDVAQDNGWEDVRAVYEVESEVVEQTTKGIITSPYK